MNLVILDLFRRHVHVFLDDIIIASKTFEEYNQSVRLVLEKLERFNFTVDPNKFKFGVPKHRLLGFILSKDGDPKKDPGNSLGTAMHACGASDIAYGAVPTRRYPPGWRPV